MNKNFETEMKDMIIFLCQSYLECKKKYHDSILEQARDENGNCAGLTKQQRDEICKFPLIQGTNMNLLIQELAKHEKKSKRINTKEFLENFQDYTLPQGNVVTSSGE